MEVVKLVQSVLFAVVLHDNLVIASADKRYDSALFKLGCIARAPESFVGVLGNLHLAYMVFAVDAHYDCV